MQQKIFFEKKGWEPLIYSIVRTFVRPPFPAENHGKPRKSLVNSDF